MGSRIFAAATLGDVNAVLSAGDADLLRCNATGETLLHVAAMHGHSELVKRLVLKLPGADHAYVTAPDLHGRTPLHLAAFHGKLDVVVELLKFPQVDRTCVDHSGQTPLLLAALDGHTSVIEELLKGPKHQQLQQIIVADRHGNTTLHLALWHAHADTVRFLLKNFEAKQAIDQLTCKNQLGWMAMHLAAGMGRADIVEEIFNTCQDTAVLSPVSVTGWSPLHVASWLGHAEIVKVMCGRMGVCVNTTSNNLERLTPLHIAAHNGHDAVVDYLLSHEELQVGCCDALRRTALHYAARQGHASVVSKLLSYKSKTLTSSLSVNATDINGFTALHLSAREGHEQVVCILLKEQANVNAKTESSLVLESLLKNALSSNRQHETTVDPMILEADCWCINQMTPLHFAARNGHMAVVRQLLERPEVDIRALDGRGLMPQDWAEVRKVKKEFLFCVRRASLWAGETSARVPKKKLERLRAEMMARKKTLVELPPSIFHYFQCMQGMAEVCEDLDKVGNGGKKDENVIDPLYNLEKDDRRGMHLRSRSYDEDFDTTEGLLQEIYTIKPQDQCSGNTPLHVAVRHEDKKAVEILVNCGLLGDVNVKNSDGHTALALAFKNNDVEICRLILQNSKIVDDDLHEMLKTAMARNWLPMGALLLGDSKTRGGGSISTDLLDEALHSPGKGFLDLLLRRSTIKERLLQERKEHLDSAAAMLVIAALIASVTYQGNTQPPQGKHHRALLIFDWLNAIAFYSAVAATIAVASGSLPIRHMYELIDARDPMQMSRVVSCVFLIISSSCVVWAYAAAGFSKGSDNKVFSFGNGVGAIATTLILLLFLKHYIQLYKPFRRSPCNGISGQSNEGYNCALCRRGAEIVQKLLSVLSRRKNDDLQDNLLAGSAELSSVVAQV